MSTVAIAQTHIPETAGSGVSTVTTQDVPKDSAVSSNEKISKANVSGVYKNLGADIKNINGYDILNFSMEPGSSLITNQETMSYMDGGLVTSAQFGNDGFLGGIKRGITGASILQNLVTNPTPSVRKITLSPLLQGSIVQINVKSGERWRFSDRGFIACTPNLTVSGDLNIFSNFRLLFVGENLTYTTVSADKGTEGIVWISSFGAVVKHDMDMGTADTVPLFINNGCFLGMLDHDGVIDYWADYVDVGTANDLFSALFTQLGWVMKIQDSNPPKNASPVRCTVLTQSLNPHNFERYIANIASSVASNKTVLTSGYGSGHGVVLGSAVATGAVVSSNMDPSANSNQSANTDPSANGSSNSSTWWSSGSSGSSGSNEGSGSSGSSSSSEGGTRRSKRRQRQSRTYRKKC